MRGKKAILLGVLLIILTGVALTRLWPYLGEGLRQYRRSRVASTPTPAPVNPWSRQARLKDGSFNPLPPVKAAVSDDPATLLEKLAWRERYKGFITPASGPGFYVYPFLDRTPEGLGVHFTYGWHLTGMAALAQWTDARLAGRGEPIHYGLPLVEESGPAQFPTLEAWGKQALADPAARDARYVLCGAYDYDAAAGRYILQVKLLDRQTSGAAARDLVTTSSAANGDFNQLAAAQRALARQLAGRVIALGLAHPRPTPQAKGVDLDKELGEVARLLDASDSWAVMEGIDRALALAGLFPNETLPLQAAAYGMNTLNWSYYEYAIENCYSSLYALRSYALSQVALAIDPEPSLTQMNWTYALMHFGHPAEARMKAFPAKSGSIPELSGLLNVMLFNSNPSYRPDQAAMLPDWQILWLDSERTEFYGSNTQLQDFTPRIKDWAAHDLYLMALLQGYRHQYAVADMGEFASRLTGARFAAVGLTAAECAAMLAAEGPGRDADQLINALADQGSLKREELAPLVAAHDYYRLRQALLKAFWNWAPPAEPANPMYLVLTHLEAVADTIMRDPRQGQPLTAYAGFEFTPAERVRFNHQRDGDGMVLAAEQGGKVRSLLDELTAPATADLRARPSDAAAYIAYAELLELHFNKKEVPPLTRNVLKQAYQLFPLYGSAALRLGRCNYYLSDDATGDRYLKEYQRTDAFNPFRNKELGELYQDYGYRAKAIKYLGKFSKDVPTRYDVANEWADAMCQIGRSADPVVRQTYARPVHLLPGNASFHEANLNYLFYWARETTSTREAAQYYLKAIPQSPNPTLWLSSLEAVDGKTTKALEILDHAKSPGGNPLSVAVYHTSLAERYMNLKRLDKAEAQIKLAEETGTHQGSIYSARGRLAFMRGQYDEAMKNYQFLLDTYGFDPDEFLSILDCLEKKGQTEKAILMLEEKIATTEPAREANLALCQRLMHYYAVTKRGDRMPALMDKIVKSPNRRRRYIIEAAEDYEKFHPKEAGEIRKNLNRIMAGPED